MQDRTITVTIAFEKDKMSRSRSEVKKEPIVRKSTREFKESELKEKLDAEPFIDFPYPEEGDIVTCVPSDLIRERLQALDNKNSLIVLKGDFYEFASVDDCKQMMYVKVNGMVGSRFHYDPNQKKHVLKFNCPPTWKAALISRSIPLRENKEELEIDARDIYDMVLMRAQVYRKEIQGLSGTAFKNFDVFNKACLADCYFINGFASEVVCVPVITIMMDFESLHNGVFTVFTSMENGFPLYDNKAKLISAVHDHVQSVCGLKLNIDPQLHFDTIKNKYLMFGDFTKADLDKLETKGIEVFRLAKAISFLDAYSDMIDPIFVLSKSTVNKMLTSEMLRAGESKQADIALDLDDEVVAAPKGNKKPKSGKQNRPSQRARLKRKKKAAQDGPVDRKDAAVQNPPVALVQSQVVAEPPKMQPPADAKQSSPINGTLNVMFPLQKRDSLIEELNTLLNTVLEYSSEPKYIFVNLTPAQELSLNQIGIHPKPVPTIDVPGGMKASKFGFQIDKKEIRQKIKERMLAEAKSSRSVITPDVFERKANEPARPRPLPLHVELFGLDSKEDARATPRPKDLSADSKTSAIASPKANGMFTPKPHRSVVVDNRPVRLER